MSFILRTHHLMPLVLFPYVVSQTTHPVSYKTHMCKLIDNTELSFGNYNRANLGKLIDNTELSSISTLESCLRLSFVLNRGTR